MSFKKRLVRKSTLLTLNVSFQKKVSYILKPVYELDFKIKYLSLLFLGNL